MCKNCNNTCICNESPVKLALYKTATIRMDGLPSYGDMLPGDIVFVKYWKHVFEPMSGKTRPLFFISKTKNFEHHINEGTFATVFDTALKNFVL